MMLEDKITLENIKKILRPLKVSGKDLEIKVLKNEDKTSCGFLFSDVLEKLYEEKKWHEIKGFVIVEKNNLFIFAKKIELLDKEVKLRIRNFCYKITTIDKNNKSYLVSYFRIVQDLGNFNVIPKVFIAKEIDDPSSMLLSNRFDINLLDNNEFKTSIESDKKQIGRLISENKYIKSIINPISKERKKILLSIGNSEFFKKEEYKILYKTRTKKLD